MSPNASLGPWLAPNAEEQLRQQCESERRFRAIFDQVLEGVILLRPDGVVVDVNRPALELAGMRFGELVGRPLWATRWRDVVGDLRPSLRSAVLDAAEGKPFRAEVVVPGGDGQQRTFDFSINPVRPEAGTTAFLIVEARDISDKVRLEAQVRQSLKMDAIGRLAGGIAHDFNNLLTVITGFADILLAQQQPPDTAEVLGEILKAGERAAALTRQLLAFSRRQLLAPQVLDLNAVVIDLEKMLARIIGEDIDFATSLDPGLRPVLADRSQIEQILMNLVVNARDAMHAGGKLTIATCNVKLDDSYARTHAGPSPGRYVLLSVSDTGIGMSEEVKSRIFEPFFSTKEMGKGTGLGLATVFGIVKQSGGSIEVYSEPSAGTTFKIYLPQAEEGAPNRPLSGVIPPPRGTETVLLVEDDESVRALTRRILAEWGYQVLEASNGEAALQLAQQQASAIHLLLSDVVMPRMGGSRLAEQLRSLFPELRVLYLSGFTDDAVVRHGLLTAEVDFLQKPFSPVLLARKVRDVLDAPPR
jgi:PAS domain S-box-containing protein